MKLFIKKQSKLRIKRNIYIRLLFFFVVIGICSSFLEQQNPAGKELYEKNCVRCHGTSGTKHFLGAKDIQKSILDDNAILVIIQNGKRFMPSYKKKLTPEDVNSLKDYIKTLRKIH